jgi:TonB family protein
MMAGLAYEDIWRHVAVHLWQTTIVLLALLLIARIMRNAPARLRNALWWIGFAKIFMPLALLGHLGGVIVRAVTGSSAPSFSSSIHTVVVTLAGRAYYVMEPGLLIVGPRSPGSSPGNTLFAALTMVWVAGSAFMLARWVQGARRSCFPQAAPVAAWAHDIRERLDKAARSAGVKTDDVLVAPGEGVPAVAGLLKPRIVVPERAAMELDTEELRAVLIHEDAHRRRYEPLRLALQRLALTVLFFYPPLWLLLRELSTSAEMACDEAVIEAGTGTEIYAAAIVRLLGFGLEESPAVSVLGFGSFSPIRARLKRLERNRRYTTMRRHRFAMLAAVLVVVALSFIPLAPIASSQTASTEKVETPPQLKPESVAYPEYPEEALDDGIEGEVLLDVVVGSDGTVKEVTVKEGVPECPALEESAIEAVKEWTFEPALLDGEPIESEILVPLAFNLDDTKPLEVTEPPKLIMDLCPLPEYPKAELKARVEGKVLIEVMVKADGSVVGATVVEGIEGHPDMDRAAVDAVTKWRFEPATADGVPVDMKINIPIEFRLDSKKANK